MDESKAKSRPKKSVPRAAKPAKATPGPTTTAKSRRKAPAAPAAAAPVDREERVRMAAFFRAERRGFAPGFEVEDWLAAEAEVSGSEPAPVASRPRKSPARKRPAG